MQVPESRVVPRESGPRNLLVGNKEFSAECERRGETSEEEVEKAK